MRTLKLTLAYDGTDFAGWQVQPDERTVQGELEQALARVTGATIRTVASGRTDAGVHALGQVVSFDSDSRLSPEDLLRALNACLAADVRIVDAQEAKPGFHAIRDCRGKRYRYVLHDGAVPDVFLRRYAWHVYERLDANAMHVAARSFLGRHDFRSFAARSDMPRGTERTVTAASVRRGEGPERALVRFEVEADGFLHHMVRAMVGTLVEVGRGRREADWPAEVVAARDRRHAGRTAPPQGLFLVEARYDA
jgi:tRNA pseudouridine38-40 synthase